MKEIVILTHTLCLLLLVSSLATATENIEIQSFNFKKVEIRTSNGEIKHIDVSGWPQKNTVLQIDEGGWYEIISPKGEKVWVHKSDVRDDDDTPIKPCSKIAVAINHTTYDSRGAGEASCKK